MNMTPHSSTAESAWLTAKTVKQSTVMQQTSDIGAQLHGNIQLPQSSLQNKRQDPINNTLMELLVFKDKRNLHDVNPKPSFP